MTPPALSWGRWPRQNQELVQLQDRNAPLPARESMLAHGNGRSYGDSCLNENGVLLLTRRLDHYLAFDTGSGVLECEAGVLLSDILEVALRSGWTLPVVPGTALVTVGGAIANDVHGKNHHTAGSFGHHVLHFELKRSDGTTFTCSRDHNAEWFAATIGGLGLTGLITKAAIKLRKVAGEWIRGDSLRFANLREFFVLSEESSSRFEYSVAWIDCSARGARRGRGLFMRGNHEAGGGSTASTRSLRFPITPPLSLVNSVSLKAFNNLYFRRPAASARGVLWHYRPFLFPLDGVRDWNRMYGPDGFFQYQCVIPTQDAESRLEDMLLRIARSGLGSFLVVLKVFGDMPSLGLMSFARPGVTLAIDFPNRGAVTLALLDELDEITRAAGGAVYPAKDARMSAANFKAYFPEAARFTEFIDPHFSSSFWRRVWQVA